MEKNNELECVYIHGVRLDRLDLESAARRVGLRIKSAMTNHGGEGRLPLAVFTPNAEIIYRCTQDSALSALINSGDINVPDGAGVIWAAKRLGYPLLGRVPGIELGEGVIAECAAAGNRVFLLGGAAGEGGTPPNSSTSEKHEKSENTNLSVAEEAAVKLSERHPGLNIRGTHHGFFDLSGGENEEVIKKINAAAPELLIVCLGFPRQEEWIIKNRAALPGVKVMMALGGSLDVWAGRVRRAPRLLRALRLEWLWRIAASPTRARLSRAAALPAFVRLTLRGQRRGK